MPRRSRISERTGNAAIAAGGPAHLRNADDNSVNTADTVIAFTLSGSEAEAARLVTRMARSAPDSAGGAGFPEGEGKAIVQRISGQCYGVGTFAQVWMSRQG
jgi:hypothetical protein